MIETFCDYYNLKYNVYDYNDLQDVMFLAREKELQLLQRCYTSSRFELLLLYGRRRTGKTSLLKTFAKDKKSIFFSAQRKNDLLSLQEFSALIQEFFLGASVGSFSDWNAAFSFITTHLGRERIMLVFDEFPFLAEENPSILSSLQHRIDHEWKEKNLFVTLCGSNMGFMEEEVIAEKSPLYGRTTYIVELLPFDYYDSSLFFPSYSAEHKILAYGILGGIPRYLEQWDPHLSVRTNLRDSTLRFGSFFGEETQAYLRAELREPTVYNSIIEAIASGKNRLNEIATTVGMLPTSCSSYVRRLQSLRLVAQYTPAGSSKNTKKSQYRINDNFFHFWYHFIAPKASYFQLVEAEVGVNTIMERLPEYMGLVFEDICLQYFIRLARTNQLPFVPHSLGKWWGTNPTTKESSDIDVLALSDDKKKAIFCECKFRSRTFEVKDFEDLVLASSAIGSVVERYYYVISKGGFSPAMIQRAEQEKVTLLSLDDLFCSHVKDV